eukprot:c7098_g1_i1.p1 GENE.c7098_g1_i1~~c7098_g1_i1.p1  ORF type:complete len:174 (-),score=72.66 c7098_g1_i1:41-532(-)
MGPPQNYPTFEQILQREPHTFMVLQRNKNENTVVYALNVNKEGVVDPQQPVRVYWIMYAKEGHPTEDLNFIERNSAYGVTVKHVAEQNHYEVVLASLKSKPLTVKLADGNPVATGLAADGTPIKLKSIYVHAKEGWGLPTVEYVEVNGFRLDNNEPHTEKLKP